MAGESVDCRGLASPVFRKKAGRWMTVLAKDTGDKSPESPNISSAHKDT